VFFPELLAGFLICHLRAQATGVSESPKRKRGKRTSVFFDGIP
jgi:hypothetical protein